MARGQKAEVGDERVAKNGYHYTKTEDGWRLTHHVIAEQTMGRPIDIVTERVTFLDGDRRNLNKDNITVMPKVNGKQQRIERLKERIQILQAELAELQAQR